MSKFDSPAISVENKSNEQNMQITKGYLNSLASELNYEIEQIETRLSTLESVVSNLTEGDD